MSIFLRSVSHSSTLLNPRWVVGTKFVARWSEVQVTTRDLQLPSDSPWGRKELDTTERLHFHFLKWRWSYWTEPLTYGSDTAASAAAAKSLQSCPTLCNPRDGSPPGSPIPGILQARALEWIAISSSNASKWKVKVKTFSPVRLVATPSTAAHQAPLSMGFSRQEYWSGVPLPSPMDLTLTPGK